MRKTVTFPAAGEEKTVSLTGRSLIVEAANVYENINEVPLFKFSGAGSFLPIYPRSTYFYDNDNKDGFDSITLQSTAASDGDSVTLISVNDCLQTDININYAQTMKRVAGQTFSKASTDAAQGLSDVEITRAGYLPKSMYISARTNDINYGFVESTAPNQNDDWFLLKTDNPPIEVQGIDFIQKFQFASQATGTAGNLIITLEY